MTVSLHVLFLGDQAADILLLIRELRHAGFEPVGERVETAEAFAAHLDPPPAVILSDFTLPGWCGLDALRLLQQRQLEIPLLFVSGTIDEEDVVAAMREGAADYLSKDRLARLGPAVTRALELKRVREEKRRTEEALRQSADLLQAVANGTTDAIFVKGRDGRYQFLNAATAQFLGRSPAEVVGRDDSELFDPDSARVVMARDRRVMDTGQAETEEEHLTAAGVTRTYLATKSPYRDRQGNVVGVIGISCDITERRRLESQLRQAQKMEAIGQLAGGVAHDFNNLLTVINGYGELVLARLPAGDPTRELVREVVAAGDRAAGLTRQLLAFSRKAIIEPRVLDLKVLVGEVDRMLRRILGEDIQLAVVADPDAGAVRADPGLLEQVVMNLVVNARDAMPQGGHLTIEVGNAELDENYARDHTEVQPGAYVLLAISDSGSGMDEATLAHIFEPFFTTKGERGTGLGLATVFGIVKQSDGHIAVYSEVGKGTTFKVYLPRVEQRPALRKSHAGRTQLPRGHETVLLVEDEDGVRALSRHVLRQCGYKVLEARDGAEAVRVAGQNTERIDLLITDVVMPRLGGREVAERVMVLHPSVKVLFVSGYTDDAVVRHGILKAEVKFLQKPFSPASLAAKVREVLDSGS